jgi:hypothetical protein
MRPSALIVAIVAGLLAIVALTFFVNEFADWNKQQACATAGRRNCG